jgi:hypothetical protein
MNTLNRIAVSTNTRLAELRARAAEEDESGEIVEKVVIVAAAALIALAAMAAIATAVDIKIGGLSL